MTADASDPLHALLPDAPGPEGLSSVLPIEDARLALTSRLLMIRGARVSLDVQYYIIRNDIAGRLFLEELAAAARRGVRVRLLLDDNGCWGLDALLSDLDALPGVEVRLFNPFRLRWSRALSYVIDFSRTNRRMHNKALVADGRVAMLGGRNIGDEYFDVGDGVLFADLDVLVSGAVVPDVAADFERYWLAQAAVPLARAVRRPRASRVRAAAPDLAAAYRTALAEAEAILARSTASRDWVKVTLVSDDPAKGQGPVPASRLLAARLLAAMGRVEHSLLLVSAYFVPTRSAARALAGLAADGVRIEVLTNSARSTNQWLVHAVYGRWRRRLLRDGIGLWELAGDPAKRLRFTLPDPSFSAPSLRSQGVALHAKTFAVDASRLFVGSFNLDPRSVALNTEVGVLIDSPALAGRMVAFFEGDMRHRAWRIEPAGRRLGWRRGKELVTTEPGTGPFQRLVLALVGRLPIGWLL